MAYQPHLSTGISRRSLGAILLAASALLTSACQAIPAEPDQDALLAEPGAASYAIIQAAVHSLLGTTVVLATDVFVNESSISIEHGYRGSLQKDAAGGRNYYRPTRLRLVLSGGNCVLINESDGTRELLKTLSCSPL